MCVWRERLLKEALSSLFSAGRVCMCVCVCVCVCLRARAPCARGLTTRACVRVRVRACEHEHAPGWSETDQYMTDLVGAGFLNFDGDQHNGVRAVSAMHIVGWVRAGGCARVRAGGSAARGRWRAGGRVGKHTVNVEA